MLRLASQAGLDDLPDVPSLALGTGLVTPLAMTAAFAMFPNGGLAVRPRDITRVRDADGGTALQPGGRDRARRSRREVAFQMVSMLGDVVDRGTASPGAAAGRAVPGRRQDRHHRRLQGRVVRRLLARRWSPACGSASISRRRLARDAFGARYALPIWADFMQRAARVRPPDAFERPAGLHEETLCAISYRQPVDGCPLYTEYFKDGDQVPERPVPAASRHHPPARGPHGRGLGWRSRPPRSRHLPVARLRSPSAAPTMPA